MYSINEIYKKLHWNSSSDAQLHGIEIARDIKDLSLLILPCFDGESKPLWDNCARALYGISDDNLKPYLSSLLKWLEDLNWPGATIILERLKFFSGEKLKHDFIKFVDYAINLRNEEGLMWLDNLSELLDNKELKKELSGEYLGILEKHYHNPAWWYDE
jgi:hypothetical protein